MAAPASVVEGSYHSCRQQIQSALTGCGRSNFDYVLSTHQNGQSQDGLQRVTPECKALVDATHVCLKKEFMDAVKSRYCRPIIAALVQRCMSEAGDVEPTRSGFCAKAVDDLRACASAGTSAEGEKLSEAIDHGEFGFAFSSEAESI
jgi:hypothetical protein